MKRPRGADTALADASAIEPLRLTVEEARLAPGHVLHVRGWCVALRPLRRVEIRLGETLLGRAEINLPRGDVADALPLYPNAANAGFAFRGTLPAGMADGTLTATAADADDRTASDTRTLAADLTALAPLLLTLEDAVLDGGMLRVRGWAVGIAPLEDVRLWLDDEPLGAADLLMPRADVGLAHPEYPGAAQSGFVLHRSVRVGAAGRVLRAAARTADGTERETSLPLAVTGDAAAAAPPPDAATEPLRCFCDAAALSEDGALRVTGWALSRAGIAAVTVQLGTTELGVAEIGEARPDVAGAFPNIPGAANSGFRFAADLGRDCTGEHTLRLLVSDHAGAREQIEVPVRAEGRRADLDTEAGIKCFLDLPVVRDGRAAETVRGFLSLGGWAMSRAGIAGIEVFVDGRSLGQAHRGIRREDLHKALGVREALHAGFAMLVPPHALKRGAHVVRVVIRDRTGAAHEIAFTVECDPVPEGDGPWALRRKLTDAEIGLHRGVLDACRWQPHFTLLLTGELTAQARRRLRTTVASLRAQAWPHWTLAIAAEAMPDEVLPIVGQVRLLRADAATPLASLLADDDAALLLPLSPGDELGEDALLELALAGAQDRDADFLYADERRIDPADGEMRAFFKPDFAPDLLLSTNYVGRPWAVRAALLAGSGTTFSDLRQDGEYDLVLRLTERAASVRHVPKVLAARAARTLDAPAVERRALARALARAGVAGDVHPGCVAGTWRVQRIPPEAARVSIIIPTVATRGLIETAIASIRAHTPRERVEIIVVDNIQPDAPEAARWKPWFAEHADAVVEVLEPFNWSRFNNLGAQRATGNFLLFLNDDVEVQDGGWLDALLEHAARPEVGAVGPLLLYPDGTVQHAGQFLSGSIGRHAFRFSPAHEPGPFGLALTQRNVISVTGACLLTRRDVFDRVGGFDERHAVINNDLDYCLRLRVGGLRVIYTPHTRLTHHEMVSRAELRDSFDAAHLGATWADLFAAGDPYFNPLLAPDTDDYVPEQEPLRVLTIGHPLIAASRVRRILALKLDHIGDFIAAFPAFRRLKQAFPGAELTVLCAGASLTLAPLEPAIDRVIRFDFYHEVSERGRRHLARRDLERLEAELAPHRFDLAIDLRRQPDTRPILRHTGARWLAGFDRNSTHGWLDIAVEWEGDQARTHKRAHVSESLLALIDAVTAACAEDRRVLAAPPAPLRPPALDTLDPGRRLIAVHAGAGAENKQWPAANFAALIDLLTGADGAAVAIIGGPGEAAIADAVLGAVRRKQHVVSLVGAVKLADLPGLLAGCALYIGNDSGPKHIAAAVGVPTLGIHSGSVDAVEWGPMGPAAVAVRRDMSCSPCYLAFARDCHRGLACLTGIRVGDVWRTARRLLALRPPPG